MAETATDVVLELAAAIAVKSEALHDNRRQCARLWHMASGLSSDLDALACSYGIASARLQAEDVALTGHQAEQLKDLIRRRDEALAAAEQLETETIAALQRQKEVAGG